MTEIRIIVLVVVVLATVFCVGAWRKSLIAEGDKAGAARVQAEWDAREEKRKATTAQDNVIRFRNTEDFRCRPKAPERSHWQCCCR